MRSLIIIFLLFPVLVFSQTDDKSNQYGAHTTNYFHERDVVFGNDTLGKMIDTTFKGSHVFEYNLQDNQWKQDLGNIGTAMQPLYYSSPKIGTRLGMHVYDAYAIDNEDIKYYDARAPFTQLSYIQGFRGQQLFNVLFTRNINPRWNFGLDFNRISSKFQYGALENSNETSSYAFDAYTKFSTKDHRYQLLANITRFDQDVIETGGINTVNAYDIYDTENAIPNMFNSDGASPISRDDRFNYHLYHQFDLKGGQVINIFHEFDRQKHWTLYRDYELAENFSYYNKYSIDSATDYRIQYENYDNTIGAKGWINNFYYRVYGTHRVYKYWVDSLGWETERFYGGDLNYHFNDSIQLENHLELSTNDEYDYYTALKWNELFARVAAKSYSPGMFNRNYHGVFEQWENEFDNTNEFSIDLDYAHTLGGQKIQTGYTFQTVTGLIYYNNIARPEQETNTLNINSFYVDLRLNWKFLHFQNYSKYYGVAGSTAWRAPKWYMKNTFYVDTKLFKKVLEFKLGGDFYFKSGYAGYAYDPVIQQFYLQNSTTLGNYPVLDLFMDFNIKVAEVFFKLSHVNQGWWGKGYESTPDYLGTRRTFYFGVKWRLYN